MRLKTVGQNNCHPSCHAHFNTLFADILHFKYHICTYTTSRSSTSALKLILWRLDTPVKESVGWKNQHIDMVWLHEEELDGRYKEQQGAEAPHSSEPQKAHLTGEFFVVV